VKKGLFTVPSKLNLSVKLIEKRRKKMTAGKLVLCVLIVFGFFAFGSYSGAKLPGTAAMVSSAQASNDQAGFDQVQPIFEQRCVKCHSGEDPAEGLRLTSYEEAMKGAGEEEVILPGQPEDSELVKRIKGEAEPRMPLNQAPLSDDEIELIEQWIEDGAQE
jgi:uncharacterized membrane protein